MKKIIGINKVISAIRKAGDEILIDDMIEIHSGNLALISGCVKITEYSDRKLSFSFKNKKITIIGQHLTPESLINGQMSVSGKIEQVTFYDN